MLVTSQRVSFITIQVAWLALLSATAGAFSWAGIGADLTIYPLCIAIALQAIFSVVSWRGTTGRWVDFYTIFLGAALVFNAGQAMLEIFGLNQYGILGGTFDDADLAAALTAVAIGFTAMHLGALFSVRGRASAPRSTVDGNPRIEDSLRIVGATFLLLSLIPAWLAINDSVTTVTQAGYFGLYQRDAQYGFGAATRVLSAFLIPAALLLLASCDARAKRVAAIACGVIGTYVLISFFVGLRSAATLSLIGLAWLWNQRIGRLPRRVLIPAALVLLIAFPVIAAIRNIASAERATEDAIAEVQRLGTTLPVAAISELGGSLNTVAYTLDLVPEVRDYDWGIGYGYSLLSIVPNFFWDVHPVAARGLAADWLVRTVDPVYASFGGGLGYSFVAEAYLNFGWPGIVVVLALIGYVFGWIARWSTGDSAAMAFTACLLTFAPIFARGETAVFIRQAAWYALAPYLAVVALHEIRRLKTHAPNSLAVGPARSSLKAR